MTEENEGKKNCSSLDTSTQKIGKNIPIPVQETIQLLIHCIAAVPETDDLLSEIADIILNLY